MPFQAETYRVLIASPSDLAEERQVATDAINERNAQHAMAEGVVLLPVKWETHNYYHDDFGWGMLNGKLSALRWVLGDDWDNLDT